MKKQRIGYELRHSIYTHPIKVSRFVTYPRFISFTDAYEIMKDCLKVNVPVVIVSFDNNAW